MKRKRSTPPNSLVLLILLILFLIYNPLSVRIMTYITAVFHDIDTDIFYGIIAAESSFNSFAVSRSKAVGLGQVKVSTAKYIYPNYVAGMLYFPPTNLHIAAIYYKYLFEKYKGNHSLSLAAYNWGEGNVDRKLAAEGISVSPEADYRELFRNVPETYHYLRKVLEE